MGGVAIKKLKKETFFYGRLKGGQCDKFWSILWQKTMMAGMILREPENGKKYCGRVDIGMTTMKCS